MLHHLRMQASEQTLMQTNVKPIQTMVTTKLGIGGLRGFTEARMIKQNTKLKESMHDWPITEGQSARPGDHNVQNHYWRQEERTAPQSLLAK